VAPGGGWQDNKAVKAYTNFNKLPIQRIVRSGDRYGRALQPIGLHGLTAVTRKARASQETNEFRDR
jgi:hypothetical protein